MKYCSLDLELTGFDPLKDEILEIGFAFFEPAPEGLRVTEQWSQVFRPKGEVHPKILGLTGITVEELQTAPPLADLHDTIQKKLNGAVIVGHNIVLDAKFLEAFGFKLSGEFIDTLDLVQFLLPTHHSYNLENLMHTFSIPHLEAHRALGDSLATIALLEQLVRRFRGFSPDLQEQIFRLIASQEFLWQELFQYPFVFPPASPAQAPEIELKTDMELPVIVPGKVTLVPFNQTSPHHTAQALGADPSKFLLVVDDKLTVLKLWQQGLVHGLFSPPDRFDAAKFDHLLAQKDLTGEQVMFCLKVLVWLGTNWQTETIIDLNLSFFGGQFRSLVSNRSLEANAPVGKVICCDYETFAFISEQKLYSGRAPVLWNAHRLEQWLSAGSQDRLTWNKALYLLKSIYNPETDFGRLDLREPVIAALAAADLFFSLVNLNITRHFRREQYVSYERLAADDFVFNKIKSAAENFSAKVEALFVEGEFFEISKFIAQLAEFFAEVPEHVKWIEASETNCVFVDRPLHIAPIIQEMLQPYSDPAVIENLPDPRLVDYVLRRLGWPGLEVLTSAGADNFVIQCLISREPLSEQYVLSLLQPANLPALVIFPEKAAVRGFYDRNYLILKKFAHVLAQSYSGGSNKILRNLAIRSASILLATPGFVARSPHAVAGRTLILAGLPRVQTDHPYTQALNNYWQIEFPGFLELLSVAEFYALLQVVLSADLESLHISPAEGQTLDQLTALTDSVKNLPFLEVILA
jgi:DNA polymerase III epsilon subunit-like protein